MKIFKKIFTMEIWGHQGIERGVGGVDLVLRRIIGTLIIRFFDIFFTILHEKIQKNDEFCGPGKI